MTQTTTLTLLPQTIHNDGTVVGEAKQAASYYVGNRDLQTINWSVSNFEGSIHIQATLSASPLETDWFPVFNVTYSNESIVSFTNITGNFVWMRVTVTNFSLGVIQYIKMSY